jgi:hypothetical protein
MLMHYRTVKNQVFSSRPDGKDVERLRSQPLLKKLLLSRAEFPRKLRTGQKTNLPIFHHQGDRLRRLADDHQKVYARPPKGKSRLPSEAALSPELRKRRDEADFQASPSGNPGIRKGPRGKNKEILLSQGISPGNPGIEDNACRIGASSAILSEILPERAPLDAPPGKIHPELGSSVTRHVVHSHAPL